MRSNVFIDARDIQLFDSESGRRLPYERVAVRDTGAEPALAESEHG